MNKEHGWKVYEKYKKGNLIEISKLYINKNTYDVEETKTENNFSVDSSLAKVISILNKKGYKTISSTSLKVCSYNLIKRYYDEKDLLIDKYGNKFIPISLSSTGYYVKYQLLDTCCIDNEKIGTFKVMNQITQCKIKFDKEYAFPNLPKYFDYLGHGLFGKTEIGVSLLKDDFDKRFYENRYFEDYEGIQKEIDEINNELLKWVKSLKEQKQVAQK